MTTTSVASNTWSSFMSRNTSSYTPPVVLSTTSNPSAPNTRWTDGAAWNPKWKTPERLVSPWTRYSSIRRQAHALRCDHAAEKSYPLKSTFRSDGTVSCARLTFSPEENNATEIAGGSPSRARGTENSLNRASPNWSADCCPLAFRSGIESQAPVVVFHEYQVASSVPCTY